MSSNFLIFIPDNINIKLRQFSSPACSSKGRDGYKQLIISHSADESSLPTMNNDRHLDRDLSSDSPRSACRSIRYINFPSKFHLEVLESSQPSAPGGSLIGSGKISADISSGDLTELNHLMNSQREFIAGLRPGCDFPKRNNWRSLSLEISQKPGRPQAGLSKGVCKKDLAFLGTLRSFIRQLLTGTFKRTLVLNGVGYKIELISHRPDTSQSEVMSRNYLKFIIGYSHPVFFSVPQDINCVLINSNTLELSSYSLQNLTQFLHKIIQTKPAYKDKYKNKGFELK